MSSMRVVVIAVIGTLLSACEVTRQNSGAGFQAPQGNFKLIVMPPDVSVGELTAGGAFKRSEDWTDKGRTNVIGALEAQEAAHGAPVRIATKVEDAGYDPAATKELILLHRVVGSAIQAYKYGATKLPTKANSFDWTLGEPAVAFGSATHYDYALFIHAQDSFESSGRAAIQAAGFLSCLAGLCVFPLGGMQYAFASLVDLRTGYVVWFNVLQSGIGDIRTADGANRLVGKLLGGLKPGKLQRKTG